MNANNERSTRPGVTRIPGSRYRGASGSEPLAPIREIGYRQEGTIGGEGERLRIGTVNVGTMRGREGEVVEMMERRCLDFGCVQETRRKGREGIAVSGWGSLIFSGVDARKAEGGWYNGSEEVG